MNFQLYSNSTKKKTQFPISYTGQNSKRKNSDPSVKFPIGVKQEKVGQFILGKTLGKGTFGKVKLGVHTLTGEKVLLF